MSRDGTDPVSLDALELDGSELLGTVIADRYKLEAVLGRGGMGLVYRASHLGLRRLVAVKILHPSLAASADVRNRFEREAFAAGKIDHPNCINVMDSGKLPDGSRYLAMELLDGKPLSDVLEQEGQIAPGRALHILAHILRGLGHIHNAGLIHRDIKPENIFLIRQGNDVDFAKILDFGIAKGMGKTDLEEGVKLTQAGMAFGTPIYMAPEQALGNPMDGRADLYAAAVLAYEMLCGQPPFYSDDKLEVMSMHTAKPVPPMRSRLIKGARPVPSSIERLIVRGLTKKPSERYANADMFLSAVEAALETPDGGVTDVSIERPRMSHTGSVPLVTPDGRVRITGAAEFTRRDDDPRSSIADDISEVLAAAPSDEPEVTDPHVPAFRADSETPTKAMPSPLALAAAMKGNEFDDARETNPGTGVGAGGSAGRVVTAPGLGAAPKIPTRPDTPRGGVGIGIPYTGPHGEPVFGLTPEQRLAQAKLAELHDRSSIAMALEPDEAAPATTPVVKTRKRRWWLYGAIAAAAIAIGVVIALLTTGGGDDDDSGMESKAAAAAYAEHKLGNSQKAIEMLTGQPDLLAQDGEMQLVLGHAHAARFERKRALEAYAKALTLRPDLEANVEMREHLRTMAADKDPVVLAGAMDLWMRTTDPEAKGALLNAAIAEDITRRHAVVPVIERHKLTGEVKWITAYQYDLQQEPQCPARKEAVAKLRALGDRDAIAPLEQAIERRARGAPKGRYNWCLIDDARAAIGYLSGLPKKQP
ncbi:MAG TPA: serine/threonine-protein kinase [Kofleriaceae bacterium]|nr:serine/threonine-protein kinase [Kofleriaceae bacterium]